MPEEFLGLLHREESALKDDDSGSEGEEGIVLAHGDVFSGFEGSAALAHEDGASLDFLCAPGLQAAVLSVAVTSVS